MKEGGVQKVKKNDKRILMATAMCFLLTTSPVLAKQGDYLKVGSDGNVEYSMPADKEALLTAIKNKKIGEKFYKEVEEGKYLDPIEEKKNQIKALKKLLKEAKVNLEDSDAIDAYFDDEKNDSAVEAALSQGTEDAKKYTKEEFKPEEPGEQEEFEIIEIL